MTTVTLTGKGQITIPAKVRADLGIEAGDRIEFIEVEPGSYEIIAATQSVKVLKGIIRKPDYPVSIEQMNTAIAHAAIKSAR